MDSLPHKISDLERRLKNSEEQGTSLSTEMPEHQATIEMGIKQLYDKWMNINEEIAIQNGKLKSAKEYFQLVDKTETFLREANKNLLEWSKKLSSQHDHEKDIEGVKKNIENYIKKNKTNQNELLVRMTAAAGQVFGTTAFQKTQVVQKEQEETFNAINTILLQANDIIKQLRQKEDEKLKEPVAITMTHHTQTESDSPPPRPPLPILIPPIAPTVQG